jgi:hypothetical protein
LIYSTFSIALTFTIGLGLGLYGVAKLLSNKAVDYRLLGVVIALLLSFVFAYYQIDLFHQTDKGNALKSGSFIGFYFKENYLYFLPFLLLIRKYVSDSVRAPISWIFISAIILGCIGDSFYLGSRLWLRGSSVIVHFLVIFSLIELFRAWLSSVSRRYIVNKNLWLLLPIIASYCIYNTQKTNFNSWDGYIEKEKVEVIDWFLDNAGREDVILSPDLEDAYFIPLYTNSQPYVQLFDYSVLNNSERLIHYFQALELFGIKELYLQEIIKFEFPQISVISDKISAKPELKINYLDYQIWAFFKAVIYYPHNNSVNKIFSTEDLNSQFDTELSNIARSEEINNMTKVDFIIYNKQQNMKKPIGFITAFENKNYEILMPFKIK